MYVFLFKVTYTAPSQSRFVVWEKTKKSEIILQSDVRYSPVVPQKKTS